MEICLSYNTSLACQRKIVLVCIKYSSCHYISHWSRWGMSVYTASLHSLLNERTRIWYIRKYIHCILSKTRWILSFPISSFCGVSYFLSLWCLLFPLFVVSPISSLCGVSYFLSLWCLLYKYYLHSHMHEYTLLFYSLKLSL